MRESDNIGIDKDGNVIYDDGIDDGNLFLINEGAKKISDLNELKMNSIQLTKDYKWIGTGQQMIDYVKSQWAFAEGGFDWFPSTNKFSVIDAEGQGGFAVSALREEVSGIIKNRSSFDIDLKIYGVENENHILSNPYNTRNSISHEKRHLRQGVKYEHRSVKDFNLNYLELDAIKYQR